MDIHTHVYWSPLTDPLCSSHLASQTVMGMWDPNDISFTWLGQWAQHRVAKELRKHSMPCGIEHGGWLTVEAFLDILAMITYGSSTLFCKFLSYSNLSIFLLLPRFIKDLNLLRMRLGIEYHWDFRENLWAWKDFLVSRDWGGRQRIGVGSQRKDQHGCNQSVSYFIPVALHLCIGSFICFICGQMNRTEESIHYWQIRNYFWCWLRWAKTVIWSWVFIK